MGYGLLGGLGAGLSKVADNLGQQLRDERLNEWRKEDRAANQTFQLERDKQTDANANTRQNQGFANSQALEVTRTANNNDLADRKNEHNKTAAGLLATARADENSTTSLSKLINQMNALPEGDPQRKLYEDQITKLNTPARTSTKNIQTQMIPNPDTYAEELYENRNGTWVKATLHDSASPPQSNKQPTTIEEAYQGFKAANKNATDEQIQEAIKTHFPNLMPDPPKPTKPEKEKRVEQEDDEASLFSKISFKDALIPPAVSDYFGNLPERAGISSKFHQQHGRYPTDEEIAGLMRVNQTQVAGR